MKDPLQVDQKVIKMLKCMRVLLELKEKLLNMSIGAEERSLPWRHTEVKAAETSGLTMVGHYIIHCHMEA